MKIAGVIIAGGLGTRLGGREKLLVRLGGAPLAELLLRRVAPQVDLLALNVRRGSKSSYEAWHDLPLIFDPCDGACGPMSGVLAALEWLGGLENGFEWLATFPGDAPFLPRDLVARLLSAAGECRSPVVAFDGEEVQSLCAIWPRACLERVRSGVDEGRYRSVREALRDLGGRQCRFADPDAFCNLNTWNDFAAAESRILETNEVAVA